MTTLFNSKTTIRTTVAALIIGAASLGVSPAQAADTSFGFSFNSGNGIGFSIHAGDHRQHFKGGKKWRRACLDDRRIRWGLRNNGFEDIRLGQKRHGKVYVTAERGRWVYSMWVDRCNGQVSRLHRERPAHKWGHGGKWGGRNNQHLQFNFR